MFKWKKLGRVFDPTKVEGKPWLKEFAQAPDVLVFDTYVRVYFSCRSERDERGQYTSYSAYVDLDRKNLMSVLRYSEKPVLKLGETGTFDEFGTYPVSTIQNGDQIDMYYGGWTRCESIPFTVSIGKAVSYNGGKTFEKLGRGPLLTSNADDPYLLSGPKIRKYNNKWYLWYVCGTGWVRGESMPEALYQIKMAHSEDGLNWTRSKTPIIPTKLNEHECQASPDVFYKNGRYHLFFCYRHGIDFRDNERGYRIGYAYSDDLYHWTRQDELAGLDISESGFDDQSVAYPHVFELDGEVYMFYLGNHVGKYGFGLAKLENPNEVFK